jgi:aminoacyl-tRNA hydrolase
MPIPTPRSIARNLLHVAAASYRHMALRRTTFIAVTGSCGKTTTKDLIAAALSTAGPGFKTPYNGNTPWHIPRHVLRTRPSHGFSVLEVAGADATLIPLERPLGLIRPRISVVTNIGSDHFTVFRDYETTARHKGKVVDVLGPDGTAVLNADDPLVAAMASRCRGRVVTFGFDSTATVRGSRVSCDWPDRLVMDVSCAGETVTVRTQLLAAHLAPNVLAAMATAHAMGVPLRAAAEAVSAVEPCHGRMSSVTTSDGISFVLDHEKSPMWTMAASAAFLSTARARRKVVVLGTISDYQGNPGRKWPRVAADLLDHSDALVGVGPHGMLALRTKPRMAGRTIRAFGTADEALAFLHGFLEAGDLVLLKGSGADGLDEIVRRWQPRASGRPSVVDTMVGTRTSPVREASVHLVVGLGNPGQRYADTPHNVGERAIDLLATRVGATWVPEGPARIATVVADGRTLHLVKTGTYVNDSGPAVRQIADRLGIDADQCVVLLDDVNIEAGGVRRREVGSSGGHNGMASILSSFQAETVRRVKIGVGKPLDGDVAAFVLRPFSDQDRATVDAACEAAVELVLQMVAPPRAARAMRTG